MTTKSISIDFTVIPLQKKHKDEFIFSSVSDMKLNVVDEDSEDGTVVNCTNDIVIDKPDALTLRVFATRIQSILIFKDTNGNIYHLGSESYPAIVYISPRLNSAVLKVIYKSPISPFIV